MPEFKLRKTVLLVEEIIHEFGPRLNEPRRRAACLAVVQNPFAGGYHAAHPAGDGGPEAARPR